MRYRQLPTGDLAVSCIGLGNMSWPGCFWGEAPAPSFQPDHDGTRTMVAAALDAGITLFDTAEAYGRGLAETLLGEALHVLGRRDSAVIVTKVGPLFGDEVQDGRTCNLTRAHLKVRCEQSLRRLRTDRIDLYLAHWPDRFAPVEETMEAMSELVAAGKVRQFGVSNFDRELLSRARAAGQVAVNQVPYSLVDRRIEDGLQQYCASASVGILAYSPLGKGLLGGKYRGGNLPPPGDYRHGAGEFSAEALSRNLPLATRCRELADACGVTPAQLVLAWCLAQPGITAVLPGPKTIAQLLDCSRAAELDLSASVLDELDRLSRPPENPLPPAA